MHLASSVLCWSQNVYTWYWNGLQTALLRIHISEDFFLQAKSVARAQKLFCQWNLWSAVSSLNGLNAITVMFYCLVNILLESFGIKANFWSREDNKGERKRWKLKLKRRDVREEDKKSRGRREEASEGGRVEWWWRKGQKERRMMRNLREWG
jgi:hypothetical protein